MQKKWRAVLAGISLNGMFPLGHVYSQTDETYSNALTRARRTSGIRDHNLVHLEQVVARANAQHNPSKEPESAQTTGTKFASPLLIEKLRRLLSHCLDRSAQIATPQNQKAFISWVPQALWPESRSDLSPTVNHQQSRGHLPLTRWHRRERLYATV